MAIRNEDLSTATQKDRRKRNRVVWGSALIAVAVLAALGTALLLTRYTESRVAAVRVPTTRVVVARIDIPIATPLRADLLQAIDWPLGSRPEGAVGETDPLVNRVTIAPISRGEPILPAMIAAPGARGGLATLLSPGMRAAAVRVDDVVGVAGFVHPGDFVDVVATMKARDDAPFASKTILQNVKVLAVGKDLDRRPNEGEKVVTATVATLMVSSEEAERLALAATKGSILLTLRGVGDDDVVATRGILPGVLLASAVPEPRPAAESEKPRHRREAPRRVAQAPPPAQPAPKDKQVVEILRGDVYEKRDFEAQEKRR